MRVMLLAAVASLPLAACGGPETSQANNAQANISNEARPEPTAAPSAVMPVATSPMNSGEAKPPIHERNGA